MFLKWIILGVDYEPNTESIQLLSTRHHDSFLWLNNIPQYIYITNCWPIHLLMDTWIVFTFWLLLIALLWTCIYSIDFCFVLAFVSFISLFSFSIFSRWIGLQQISPSLPEERKFKFYLKKYNTEKLILN